MTKRAAVILTVTSTLLLAGFVALGWGIAALMTLPGLSVGAVVWAHCSAREYRTVMRNRQLREWRKANPAPPPMTSPESSWVGLPPKHD